MGSGPVCPKVEASIREDGSQWNFKTGSWDNVKLGWLIAGVSTIITIAICLFSTFRHARHYHRPKEQRQIIRIIWLPMVFSIISFFSYRYYRAFTYYKLILIVYEAFALMAFLSLMLAYIGTSNEEHLAVMRSKDKLPLPWPFGCMQYRPGKPYFLFALNGSVLQYVVLRPLMSVIGMICHSFNKLCPHRLSPYFAQVYSEAVDFVSISVALYGLIVFYTLVKERLAGKKPMTKFLAIKLLVCITFYQAFAFSALASNGVIKANKYWSKTNIADGLTALVTCVEMVIFSLVIFWAYPASEYRQMTLDGLEDRTRPMRAYIDAINYSHFVKEIFHAVAFGYKYALGRPGTHSSKSFLNLGDGDEDMRPDAEDSEKTVQTETFPEAGYGEKGADDMRYVSELEYSDSSAYAASTPAQALGSPEVARPMAMAAPVAAPMPTTAMVRSLPEASLLPNVGTVPSQGQVLRPSRSAGNLAATPLQRSPLAPPLPKKDWSI